MRTGPVKLHFTGVMKWGDKNFLVINIRSFTLPESARYRNGFVFTLMIEMQPTRYWRCAHSSRAPYRALPRLGQQRRPWHLRALESRFRRRYSHLPILATLISPADPEVGGIDSSLLFSHVLVARWAMRT